MIWRPEGWKDIFEKEVKNDIEVGRLSGLSGNTLIDTFEAGADAMLEALKKDGTHFKKDEWTDDATFETRSSGTVVFIPDEE